MADPAGCISLACENLRKTLADAAAFRTWTGAANQSQALARIYRTALPPPSDNKNAYSLTELQTLRPHVIVWTERYGNNATAVSDCFEFSESGEFGLRFTQDVDPAIANDPAEIQLRWENSLGTIFDDMRALAGTAGYLAITGFEWDGELTHTGKKDLPQKGDAIVAQVSMSWGAP